MKRRAFIAGLLNTLAWPLAAHAQQLKRMWRVGYLSAGDETGTGHLYRSFVQGMRGSLATLKGRTLFLNCVMRIAKGIALLSSCAIW